MEPYKTRTVWAVVHVPDDQPSSYKTHTVESLHWREIDAKKRAKDITGPLRWVKWRVEEMKVMAPGDEMEVLT